MNKILEKKEYIDLVDRHNNVIGTTDVDTAHKLKQHHRVVGIFLFSNDKKNFYLQNHKKYKLFDVSVGGHVKKNESVDSAIVRELKEELDLTITPIKIKTFLPEKAKLNHIWTIYKGYLPKDWFFQETDEVKEMKKMKLEDWLILTKKSPEMFTKGLLNTINEL